MSYDLKMHWFQAGERWKFWRQKIEGHLEKASDVSGVTRAKFLTTTTFSLASHVDHMRPASARIQISMSIENISGLLYYSATIISFQSISPDNHLNRPPVNSHLQIFGRSSRSFTPILKFLKTCKYFHKTFISIRCQQIKKPEPHVWCSFSGPTNVEYVPTIEDGIGKSSKSASVLRTKLFLVRWRGLN